MSTTKPVGGLIASVLALGLVIGFTIGWVAFAYAETVTVYKITPCSALEEAKDYGSVMITDSYTELWDVGIRANGISTSGESLDLCEAAETALRIHRCVAEKCSHDHSGDE